MTYSLATVHSLLTDGRAE